MHHMLCGILVALAGMPVLAETTAQPEPVTSWYQHLMAEPAPQQAKVLEPSLLKVKLNQVLTLGLSSQFEKAEHQRVEFKQPAAFDGGQFSSSYHLSLNWRF